MGIFDEQKSFSRKGLRDTLRKSSGAIPKTGGEKYSQSQRAGLERDVFGREYGGEISKGDWKRAVHDLKKSQRGAETKEEKREIKNKVDYLKKLGGIR